MSVSQAKLQQDLAILAAMADEMDAYLKSDVLFWPMSGGNMPRLTLGGYLFRQQRLNALRDLLPAEDQKRLDEIIAQFNQALVERIVRFEDRAHQELEARIRQWQEQLSDLSRDKGEADFYASNVETRAIIEVLLNRLRLPPYRLDETLAERVEQLDKALRAKWHSGDFVWPDAWQPAYPRDRYWWLYGRPAG